MELLQLPNKTNTYVIELEDGDCIEVDAKSYIVTEYGTYAFYSLSPTEIFKSFNKRDLPPVIFELKRSKVKQLGIKDGYKHIRKIAKQKVKKKAV